MPEAEFKGKTVVITGGARGIGACLVDSFARQGARVFFSDTDRPAGKVRAAKTGAVHVPADMGRDRDIRRFIRAVLSRGSEVHVLINNAGIGSGRSFRDRPLAEWDRVLAVNLRSAYRCAQLLTPALSRGRGAVLNISSTRALQSEPDTEPYSASKGGVRALTHSLAVTLGPAGIRVNCVSPGWIDTGAWQSPPFRRSWSRKDHAQHPAGRVGRPEDIAEACLFLASPRRAGFITGQNLVVDGGMTIKMIYSD